MTTMFDEKPETAVATTDSRFVALQDVATAAMVLADNLGGDRLTEFDLTRITMPMGGALNWSVPTLDGEEAVKDLRGVIVSRKYVRAYWAEDIGAGGGNNPPDCSSPDAVTGFSDMWEGGSRDCATCPYAQWGTKEVNGKVTRGQACKAAARLFLLRPGDMLPAVLTAPPSSLRPLKQYMLQLASSGLSYWWLETSFTLERKQNEGGVAYAGIVFKPGDRLEASEIARVAEYRRSLETITAQATVLAKDEVA